MSDPAAYYRRQFQWRDWQTAIAALPPVQGQTILDLGCGVGDLAAELATAGARLVGIDANRELIEYAQARRIPNAEFRTADLRTESDFGTTVDGIWCSFTAAYFVDFAGAITRWKRALKPGGWIAVTEVDDLFGHEPMSTDSKARLDAYCDEALTARRYDFRAGRKIQDHLELAGFSASKVLRLSDREFSCDGPTDAAVVEAWESRFDGMKLLRDFLGADFVKVKNEFLHCLTRADHRSSSRVVFCLAELPPHHR